MGFKMKHFSHLPKRRDGIDTTYLMRSMRTRGISRIPCSTLTVKEQDAVRYLNRYALNNNYFLDLHKRNVMLDGNTLKFTDPFTNYEVKQYG